MRVTSKYLIGSLVVSLLWSTVGLAQVPAQSPQHPGEPGSPPTAPTPVIVGNRSRAPQVVTILHRLNGIKMFRLLLRSGNQLGAIAKLDDAFQLNSDVHTNIIAGLALEDGTIVAWLPEAEAEMFPLATFAPKVPLTEQAMPAPPPPVKAPFPGVSSPTALFETPDVTVIPTNGRRVAAEYLGFDGLTGLSILRVGGARLAKERAELKINAEEKISVGQRLRLVGPEPAAQPEAKIRTRVYVKVGEIDARITKITRNPSGNIGRLQIGSANLAPAKIGAIAINDAGETVGIVEAVEGNEASVLPLASVRSAAKRVIERQSSVPRPWLGVRGEAVAALEVEQILRRGWRPAAARALAEKQRGILLTSIAPGSPAAVAALNPGDVILEVNDGEVRNGDDFSWLLQEAGPGQSVRFTVMKPSRIAPEAVEVRLSESFNTPFSYRMFDFWQKQMQEPGSLMAHGIEAIALQPTVATRLGATGGLLVVSVQPNTAAAEAGLRAGDVIESINGRRLVTNRIPNIESTASTTFEIVRNRQKLTMSYVSTPN